MYLFAHPTRTSSGIIFVSSFCWKALQYFSVQVWYKIRSVHFWKRDEGHNIPVHGSHSSIQFQAILTPVCMSPHQVHHHYVNVHVSSQHTQIIVNIHTPLFVHTGQSTEAVQGLWGPSESQSYWVHSEKALVAWLLQCCTLTGYLHTIKERW